MKRATVIVGAGASFDVANASAPANPDWRLPLAVELFDARFFDLRRHYTGAEVLGAELGHLADQSKRSHNAFDLEARLTYYANHSNSLVRDHFKQLPAYIRDVIVGCMQNYTKSPANYLNLVQRLLRDETHEVAFISLNYDTLLETALARYSPGFAITSMDDYIASSRQAMVVKVHGSANWAIPIGSTERDWHTLASKFDPASVSSSQILIEYDRDPCYTWNSGGLRFYPRLTAPVREKTFCCPEAHTDRLRAFLAECHKFLIIGCSGLDDDLLDFIRETEPQNAFVRYVNKGSDTDAVKKRFENRIPKFIEGVSRALPRSFSVGFREYLMAEDIEAFLAAD